MAANSFTYQTRYFDFQYAPGEDLTAAIHDQMETRLIELMYSAVRRIVSDGIKFPITITLTPVTEIADFKIVARVEGAE